MIAVHRAGFDKLHLAESVDSPSLCGLSFPWVADSVNSGHPCDRCQDINRARKNYRHGEKAKT